MKIVAFSGRIQSGKTTSVNFLLGRLKADRPLYVVNFADHLRRIALLLYCPFDWNYADMGTNKDANLPCGLTVRRLLQSFGTEMCRGIDEDCWVRAYRHEIAFAADQEKMALPLEPEALVLTGDVRFPNEAAIVHKLGGCVIRLLRSRSIKDYNVSTHSSESALDQYDKFDHTIDNSGMSLSQRNDAIWNFVTKNNWV